MIGPAQTVTFLATDAHELPLNASDALLATTGSRNHAFHHVPKALTWTWLSEPAEDVTQDVRLALRPETASSAMMEQRTRRLNAATPAELTVSSAKTMCV